MICLLLISPDLLEALVLPILEDYSRHTPATSLAVVTTAQVRARRLSRVWGNLAGERPSVRRLLCAVRARAHLRVRCYQLAAERQAAYSCHM